ncbi:hypothetical protein [Hymenobacter sp. B81]|uniref:hypothetical protein n=1 Tax=Hymenobacter sp. B81 TaxID=3344878 RepID=UPI0037DD5A7D
MLSPLAVPSFRASTVRPAPPAYAPNSAPVTGWDAIPALLEARLSTPEPLANPGGLAAYYYLLYRQHGQLGYLERAHALFNQQLAYSQAPAAGAGSPAALAWLGARADVQTQASYATCPLRPLDATLFNRLQQLGSQAQPADRAELLHLVRYFRLRAGCGESATYLSRIVELLGTPAYLVPAANSVSPAAQSLALPDGLTGELLLLTEVYQAAGRPPTLAGLIRARVAVLLATRRETDFSAGHYSIFPDTAAEPGQPACFSNHLSWGRGSDLAASLALYRAQAVLHDAELGRIAELVGLNTLLRTAPETTGIGSAQFFQGAFGVAYLYRQLHFLSGHPAYQHGHAYWLQAAERYLSQELAAGFYHTQPADSLSGALGIGLALLQLSPASTVAGEARGALEVV